MSTRLWFCNPGYYWWSRQIKDPGLKYLKLPQNISLECEEFGIPSLSSNYDYMIWCTNVVQNWDTLINNWKQVDKLKGKKAWWSFDNHHNYANELVHADHFDCCFLAHGKHSEKYRNIPNSWLPLSVVQFTVDEMVELLPRIFATKRKYDLQFRGVRYNFLNNNREKWLDILFEYAKSKGLRVDYSISDNVESIADYFKLDFIKRAEYWLLADASICAPIQDDLSTRFFDGLFFGQNVFIPRTVKDVDRLIDNEERENMGVYICEPCVSLNKFFFKKNRKLRLRRLKAALYILFNHTIIQRISTAFNIWLNQEVVTVDYDRLIEKVKESLKGYFTVNEIENSISSVLPQTTNKNSNRAVYMGVRNDEWNQLQHSRMLMNCNQERFAEKILLSLLEKKGDINEVVIDYVIFLFRKGDIKKSMGILEEHIDNYIFSAASYFKFAELLIEKNV